jgi:predicted nuclease of predicted toxin-antitoxin system
MKFLIDMNLSPKWCPVLQAEGWNAVHWSQVGDRSAPDAQLMAWALAEGRVVLTHDLDFGAILAATQAKGPSVVQVRTQNVKCDHLAPILIPVLRDHQNQLQSGALAVIDEAKSRVRILPLSES